MKRCSKCQQLKGLSEFSYKNKEKGWLISYCRKCYGVYKKEHYLHNKEDYKKKRDMRRVKIKVANRANIVRYLLSHPCVDCGETDLRVLEFDHVAGKKVCSIGKMLTDTVLWSGILNEINKCVVRCANCHRKRTAKQFGWYKAVALLNNEAPSSRG